VRVVNFYLIPNLRAQSVFFHTFAPSSILKTLWKDTRNALIAARKSLKLLRNVCIVRLGWTKDVPIKLSYMRPLRLNNLDTKALPL